LSALESSKGGTVAATRRHPDPRPHAGDPAWSAWLGEDAASATELQGLLTPFPAERMRVYPVST
jgi:hypothetical protein